jgi:tetratricopeptide (TPR) repeat protein
VSDEQQSEALVDQFNEVGAAAFDELGHVSAADDALLDQMVEAGVTASAGGGAAAAAASAETASKTSLGLWAGLGLGAVAIVAAVVAMRPGPEPGPAPAAVAPVERVVEEQVVEPSSEPPPVEAGTIIAPQPLPEVDPAPGLPDEKAHKHKTRKALVGAEHDTAAELLLAANRARRGGEREQARDLYRELGRRFSGTREHLISRVALGDLELESFKRPKQALVEYGAYLKAKPKGNLAEEALYGKARALDALGRKMDGAQAWTKLLDRFPDSLHAPAAKRRLDVR